MLEWGDWDPDYEGTGGNEYTYTLSARVGDELDQEPENDTIEGIEGWVDPDAGNYAFYGSGFSEYASEFVGNMDSSTDLDIFPLE